MFITQPLSDQTDLAEIWHTCPEIRYRILFILEFNTYKNAGIGY